MDFKGSTALITGASVGIGRACALEFARYGAEIILLDIDYEKLLSVKSEAEAFGVRVLAYRCDISDEGEVNRVIGNAIEKLGKIDILVNNAALWRMSKSFCETEADEWMRYISVNLMGTVYCSKAVIPGMQKRHYGKIINVSSVAGIYGNRNMSVYSATKGAVNSLTKSLARELSADGISVNSVCPGSVSPSDNADIDYSQPTALSCTGRTGTDRENAALICFLASREASYIAGQTIQIDGCRKTLG